MKALLCIDAGNTRVKWGVYRGRARGDGGAVAHDDLARIFAGEMPDQVIASNVAGAHVATLLAEQCRLNEVKLHVIASQATQCGVVNRYRDPRQLGTDRWAALIGARRVGEGAKVVVMAGTATTVDALSADGEFLGGLILPGIALMRGALNRNTAQLGIEEGRFDAFPRSTPDAIMSGAIQATVGAIEHMRAELGTQSREAPQLVVSGGAARDLLPRLPSGVEWREHLVLEGLVEIAAETLD